MLKVEYPIDCLKEERGNSQVVKPLDEGKYVGQINESSQHNQEQDLQKQLDDGHSFKLSGSEASAHQRKRYKRSDNYPQPGSSFQVNRTFK